MNKLQQNNENQLKAYFETIFKLNKSGKQFPVDLDEVWPLVYERKDHAVRDLKESFVENVDYQFFPKIEEKSKRGRPSEKYMLTTAALEWLIVRKVNTVFEVYRQVFHRTRLKFESHKDMSQLTQRPVQVQNSKEVNHFIWENGETKDIIEYNRQSCLDHTGKTPSEWKEYGRQLGLKSKDRTSGKEVLRHVKPELACAMSLTDDLVKVGQPYNKAKKLALEHGVHIFKAYIDMGIIPNELNK